jgi:hypothetical protein
MDRPAGAVGHPFAALVAGMVRYDGFAAEAGARIR